MVHVCLRATSILVCNAFFRIKRDIITLFVHTMKEVKALKYKIVQKQKKKTIILIVFQQLIANSWLNVKNIV